MIRVRVASARATRLLQGCLQGYNYKNSSVLAPDGRIVRVLARVAVISETAGVATEMGASTLLVSPLDIEGTPEALAWALDMPTAERASRLAQMRARIRACPSSRWLEAQLDALGISSPPQAAPAPRVHHRAVPQPVTD